jgi:hypothetical protein
VTGCTNPQVGCSSLPRPPAVIDAHATENEPSISGAIKPRHRRRNRTAGFMAATALELPALQFVNWTHEFLAEAPENDSDLDILRRWLLIDKQRPIWDTTKTFSPSLRALCQQWDSLIIIDNIVYRIYYGSDAAVLYSGRFTSEFKDYIS